MAHDQRSAPGAASTPHDLSREERSPSGPPPGEPATPVRGAWLLATALAFAAEDTPVATAVDAIVAEAQGHPAALRAAYAGGLALAAELPDDRAARHTIDLLTHALHDAAVRRGGAPI